MKTGLGSREGIGNFTLSRIFQGDIFSNVLPIIFSLGIVEANSTLLAIMNDRQADDFIEGL
jgi:hypothetical protein